MSKTTTKQYLELTEANADSFEDFDQGLSRLLTAWYEADEERFVFRPDIDVAIDVVLGLGELSIQGEYKKKAMWYLQYHTASDLLGMIAVRAAWRDVLHLDYLGQDICLKGMSEV